MVRPWAADAAYADGFSGFSCFAPLMSDGLGSPSFSTFAAKPEEVAEEVPIAMAPVGSPAARPADR